MTLDDSILTMRLRVMRRAHELNSVTLACQEAGISRTLFYRWRKRFERYGADGLHPRRQQARRGRPPQIAPHTERLILGVALAWPTWGWGCAVTFNILEDDGLVRLMARAGCRFVYTGLESLSPESLKRSLALSITSQRRLEKTVDLSSDPRTGNGSGNGTGTEGSTARAGNGTG